MAALESKPTGGVSSYLMEEEENMKIQDFCSMTRFMSEHFNS